MPPNHHTPARTHVFTTKKCNDLHNARSSQIKREFSFPVVVVSFVGRVLISEISHIFFFLPCRIMGNNVMRDFDQMFLVRPCAAALCGCYSRARAQGVQYLFGLKKKKISCDHSYCLSSGAPSIALAYHRDLIAPDSRGVSGRALALKPRFDPCRDPVAPDLAGLPCSCRSHASCAFLRRCALP